MTTRQGWDRADFSCGRCGWKFTAKTESQYVLGRSIHESAHELVDVMPPELRASIACILGAPSPN